VTRRTTVCYLANRVFGGRRGRTAAVGASVMEPFAESSRPNTDTVRAAPAPKLRILEEAP